MESAPGNRIGAGEKQKGHFGIVPDHGKKNKQQQNQNTGLFLAPGQIFETIKTNGAGHQSAEADSEKQPSDGPAPVAERSAGVKRVDDRGNSPRGGRGWHAHEKFRAAGSHALHIESRQTPCTTDQKSKRTNSSELAQLDMLSSSSDLLR